MASATKVKPGFSLSGLGLDRRLADEAIYQQKLHKLQLAMLEPEQIYRVEGRRGIIALEGWDAAGKGGAIQRLTEKLDPRWVHVWSIGRPSPEEQGRHYLWRFWQRLPPPGQIAIFDRTWYGRVLVERVEGLARPGEWRRAYDEINSFEKMLADDGVRLVKMFLHISDEEQLRRFRERIETPTKRWKMTAEDIHNREHRRDYLAALDDMFARTSTADVPWHVVPAEYKWFARIAVAKTVVKALGKGIRLGPPPLDPEVAKAAAARLDRKEVAALGLTAAAFANRNERATLGPAERGRRKLGCGRPIGSLATTHSGFSPPPGRQAAPGRSRGLQGIMRWREPAAQDRNSAYPTVVVNTRA